MQFSIQDHLQRWRTWLGVTVCRGWTFFGSAATHKFDARRSDLDFLVVFRDDPPGGMARAYFGLLEELQQYFNRPVDLATERSMQNPYFRQSVNENRRPSMSRSISRESSKYLYGVQQAVAHVIEFVAGKQECVSAVSAPKAPRLQQQKA